MKKKLPKSIRKYIRKEKSRIRREVLDIKKQNDMITQLYSQFLTKINSTESNIKMQNAKSSAAPKFSSPKANKIKITNQNAK